MLQRFSKVKKMSLKTCFSVFKDDYKLTNNVYKIKTVKVFRKNEKFKILRRGQRNCTTKGRGQCFRSSLTTRAPGGVLTRRENIC